jgi:hypothetical protein
MPTNRPTSQRIGGRFNRMRHRGGLVLRDGDGFREAVFENTLLFEN